MLSKTLEVAAVTEERATMAASSWDGLMVMGWNSGRLGRMSSGKAGTTVEVRGGKLWCDVELGCPGATRVCQHGWNANTGRDARRNSQAPETSDWQGRKATGGSNEGVRAAGGGEVIRRRLGDGERRQRKATGGLCIVWTSDRGASRAPHPRV